MSHYTGLDKLCSAIWCEIFVVKEGYIPYLKKWLNPQHSAEIDPNKKKKSWEEDVHSNIQRLCPGGLRQLATCKHSPTLMIQGSFHRSQISDSPATNLQRDNKPVEVEVEH